MRCWAADEAVNNLSNRKQETLMARCIKAAASIEILISLCLGELSLPLIPHNAQ